MNYQPPKRRFESKSYVNPKTAYYVPLEIVTHTYDNDIKTLVDRGQNFSVFAPVGSGKTTFFRSFAKSLEADPEYIFLFMSFENCKNYDSKRFYQTIQDALYDQLIHRLEAKHCLQLEAVRQFIENHELEDNATFHTLMDQLNRIIKGKKMVIFIEEFDDIPLGVMSTFLSTLRALNQEYKAKKEKALYSVALIGVRNITHKVQSNVSPYNISVYVDIRPFTLQNVRDLYLQYTQETNQPFTEEAVQKVFEQTQGQPWLVNRLGSILTKQIKPETIDPIETVDVNKAIQQLLKEKNAHFDHLKEKLVLYKNTFNEINTQPVEYFQFDEAQSWLETYGLIKKQNDFVVIANPIYSQYFSDTTNQMNYIREQKKKIFISYAHDDKSVMDQLSKYLNIVKINNIDFWFDQKIRTVDDWPAEIQNAIETAHLTICLISNSYLGSTFVQKREFPAIQTRQKEGMVLFPIIIKDCLWKAIPWFKNVQIFPEDGIPLQDLSEKEQKKKFMELVQHIFDFFEINQSK